MSFAFLIQLGHSADERSFANNWRTSGQICAVQNVNGKVSRHAHLGITSGQRIKIIDPRNTRALKVFEVDSGCRCFAECWLFLPICKVDQRWHCTLSNQGCNGSPSEQNNETIATNCRNMRLVPQKLSTVGCFAWSVCLYADHLGGVDVFLLGCCCFFLLLDGCWGLLGAHSWPTARSGQCEVRFVWGGPARAGQSLSKRRWSWVWEYRTKKDLWLAVIYCCPLTRTWGHWSERWMFSKF